MMEEDQPTDVESAGLQQQLAHLEQETAEIREKLSRRKIIAITAGVAVTVVIIIAASIGANKSSKLLFSLLFTL